MNKLKNTKKSAAFDRSSLIINLFREFPNNKFSLKHLASASGGATKEGRLRTREIITELLAQGTIEECGQEKYRLSGKERPRQEGIVQMISTGAMYIRSEEFENDVYVSQRNSLNALDGDRVEFVITRRSHAGSLEGEITRIVERSRKQYVGTADVSDHAIFVKMDPRRMPMDVYLSKRDNPNVQHGDKVVIRITDWALGSKSPAGELVEVLGRAGENNTEMHAILAEYGLPYHFEQKVEDAAQAIPSTITKADYAARRDFRKITTFTIDPADAKDFDDALSIRKIEDGVWEVGVHIADVTHYVQPRSVIDTEAEDFDAAAALERMKAVVPEAESATVTVEDEETLKETEMTAYYSAIPEDADKDTTVAMTYQDAVSYMEENGFDEPDPAAYGVWVPGIPVLIENGLDSIGCADWLKGLILDGIVAGVGAVLGFVPQMLVLFLLLAFLEACGYMARIAFVLDRVFRKFGLSGKSFIPILIGTGCGIPGIMASRTIENERDRRMTIMTTTFIPCGAKVPFIAMIAGALFGGSPWVSTSAYFIGMAAIIISGIMLKKSKLFAGDPAPFVMELPAYHWPTLGNVLRSMWERGWSFIKKAGTIILLSTIFVWFTTYFGVVDGAFQMLSEDQIDHSILAAIGNAIAWIFTPLGWGNWQAAVASITGLVAKENIVGTLGILYGGGDTSVYANLAQAFTGLAGYSFLVFNLLCAPCFAAIGAIKREMNNAKWTWAAIGYQCGFAYVISLMIYNIGLLFQGTFSFWTVIAIALLACMIYLLVRKNPYDDEHLTQKVSM